MAETKKKGRLFDLPETKGAFQLKGVVSGMEKDTAFKEIKTKYNLKIDHFSTHTMRKTFGRKVFESAGTDAPLALMRLQTLFNHASPTITKTYLGLTESELESSYDLLDF